MTTFSGGLFENGQTLVSTDANGPPCFIVVVAMGSTVSPAALNQTPGRAATTAARWSPDLICNWFWERASVSLVPRRIACWLPYCGNNRHGSKETAFPSSIPCVSCVQEETGLLAMERALSNISNSPASPPGDFKPALSTPTPTCARSPLDLLREAPSYHLPAEVAAVYSV